MTLELTRDHRHLGDPARIVLVVDGGDVVVPEHREVRLGHLVGGRQVQPDLEQLERVRTVSIEQGEHLGVDDAAAGGQPLHVTASEPRGRAE